MQLLCSGASRTGLGVSTAGCFLSLLLFGGATRLKAAEQVSFVREVRPVLSDKCFACHGPDAARREGGFRLDVRESALAEADSGLRPIVPGDPEKSELMRRIVSDDEFEQMPPPETHKSVSPQEAESIRRWIAAGAPWDVHWSLAPLRRPATPQDPDTPREFDEQWARNDVDRFVLRRLADEGLSPQPEATRAALLRRVSLDLTGLPPKPAQVEAFLNDTADDAYERLVDALLASPQYGEHLARYWLDAARYGDTHGLHLDNYREMWPYRDWVVRALNANMPFDQFVIEQIAGDLLPEADDQQLIATGFNRCHVTTNEGGSIAEEVYVRNVVDRVDTFGTVFLGLTVGCSRCHDHKFDPLTMDDYYSLFAYFNSLDGKAMDDNRKDPPPVLRAPTAEQRRQLAELEADAARLESQLSAEMPELDQRQLAWERELAALAQSASSESDAIVGKEGGSHQLVLGTWYSVGPFTGPVRYLKNRNFGPEGSEVDLQKQYKLSTGQQASWQQRPEWNDGQVHNDLPGAPAANYLYRTIQSAGAQQVELSLGSDDGIKVYLNGKAILENFAARGAAPDQEKLKLDLRAGANHLLIKIINFSGASGFYFAVTSDQPITPGSLVEIVQTPAPQRTPKQREALRSYFRNSVSDSQEVVALRNELAAIRERRAAVDREVGATLIWRERSEPRPAFVLLRGEYDQRDKQVERCTPSALPPMAEDLSKDRLGLAKWLVSPDHPLTARVAVNRWWQQLFGVGLVKTADDFGSQGEAPSHPELLDWLASEFRAGGWNVKALVKQLVMSATYRQSSAASPELYRRDPENRLLARGPRFRLDAEVLRDQALSVSGLLVERLGGPSVKPPQPAGLWFAVGYSGSNTVRFAADEGDEKTHRRSLYTFIKRTAPPPQMSVLDGPSRESCVVRRERTNTPLQALLLLNDPQYVDAARALAERTLREGGDSVDQQAAFMFQLCLCRRPDVGEMAELLLAYYEELQHFTEHPESARELLHVDDATSADSAELAAWMISASTLLNLDEVVTKN